MAEVSEDQLQSLKDVVTDAANKAGLALRAAEEADTAAGVAKTAVQAVVEKAS